MKARRDYRVRLGALQGFELAMSFALKTWLLMPIKNITKVCGAGCGQARAGDFCGTGGRLNEAYTRKEAWIGLWSHPRPHGLLAR